MSNLSEAVVEAIVKDAVQPTLGRLLQECPGALRVRVCVIDQGRVLHSREITAEQENASRILEGEIRILVRESGAGFRYEAQAVLRGFPHGLSGFHARGSVVKSRTELTARPKGIVLRYNSWEWEPHFRAEA